MPVSVPQFLFEFSILLGTAYLLIRPVPLRPADRNSLLAGIPLLCLLLPGLRWTSYDLLPGYIAVLPAAFSLQGADWGLLIRQFSLSGLLLLVYWAGFAVGLGSLIDRVAKAGIRPVRTAKPWWKRPVFPATEYRERLVAGLAMVGRPADSRLLEVSHLQLRNGIQFRHFFEVLLLESMVLFFWWNPLMYLYRRAYRRGLRQQLYNLHAPSRAANTAHYDLPRVGRRLTGWGVAALLVFNLQPFLPGGETYHQFFAGSEEQLSTRPFGDNPALQPEARLQWGGHEIPLAAVRAENELAYEVYFLQPFEFHQMRRSLPYIRYGSSYPDIDKLHGWIGLPHTDQLSVIGSLREFHKRLPRLVTMGEHTLYLRLEDVRGNSWVAVLAISDKGMAYHQETGIRRVARDMAATQLPGDPLRESYSPFRLNWGKLDIPLEKYASPNVYRGLLEVPIDSLLPQLRGALQVSLGDSLLPIEELTVRAYGSPSWRSVVWFPALELEGDMLRDESMLESLINSLAPGHEISIYGKVGNLHLNTVVIRVHDPNQLYRPTVRVPRVNRAPAEDRYQLINRPGYQTLVRLDTLHPANRRILDIYREQEGYRIVHVPGFRTNERLVNVWESTLDFIEAEDWITADDLSYYAEYPEYHGYHDSVPRLNWGSMWAMPNSEVYSPDEYELNRREGIRLRFGKREMVVERATAVYARNGVVQGVYLLDEKDMERPHLLPKVPAETSVFFGNLILRDTAGERSVLPVNFAFHIGKETGPDEWSVEIVPDREGVTGQIREEGRIIYRHYRLSDLIPELLEVKKSRLIFEKMTDDPLVRVIFRGSGYREQQARELMLRSLQKRYEFVVEHARVPADVRRLQVNYEDRLLPHRYAEDLPLPENRIRTDEADGRVYLEGVTLYELAEVLEERYGLVFELYPTPYNHLTFSFIIDDGSLNDVADQLQATYGIKVFESGWLFNGLRVQFSGG